MQKSSHKYRPIRKGGVAKHEEYHVLHAYMYMYVTDELQNRQTDTVLLCSHLLSCGMGVHV